MKWPPNLHITMQQHWKEPVCKKKYFGVLPTLYFVRLEVFFYYFRGGPGWTGSPRTAAQGVHSIQLYRLKDTLLETSRPKSTLLEIFPKEKKEHSRKGFRTKSKQFELFHFKVARWTGTPFWFFKEIISPVWICL